MDDPTVSAAALEVHVPNEIGVWDQGPSAVRQRKMRYPCIMTGGPPSPPVIAGGSLAQPRWIWMRREAASAEGLGIRISRTPSL